MNRVLMVGASNGGQMMSAILEEASPGTQVDFIDDNRSLWGTRVCGHRVLELPTDDITSVLPNYTHAFISIALHSLLPFRRKMMQALKGRIPLINIIHPTVHISKTAVIGEGNYLSAFSYLGPYSSIGDCNFLSAHTVIEHHSSVGNLNSWGPSNTTSGMCHVGDEVCFGTNISMVFSVSIGSGSIVSSDVVLNRSVPAGSVVRKVDYPDYKISANRRSRIQ